MSLSDKDRILLPEGMGESYYWRKENNIKESIQKLKEVLLKDWIKANGKTFTLNEVKNRIDEGFELQSILDRIVLDTEEWRDFGILVRYGFEHLKRVNATDNEVKQNE